MSARAPLPSTVRPGVVTTWWGAAPDFSQPASPPDASQASEASEPSSCDASKAAAPSSAPLRESPSAPSSAPLGEPPSAPLSASASRIIRIPALAASPRFGERQIAFLLMLIRAPKTALEISRALDLRKYDVQKVASKLQALGLVQHDRLGANPQFSLTEQGKVEAAWLADQRTLLQDTKDTKAAALLRDDAC
jgi:DNA-binding MarR family transcriptional regulator